VYDWLFEEQAETTKNFKECCVLFAFSVSTHVYETCEFFNSKYSIKITVKGKAIPLQPWAGRLYPIRKYSWYSFLLEAEATPGP